MSKLTKSYKSNFTTVPNHILNDKTISLKAKGIYLFLISKPDSWHFSVDRIAAQNSDGESSVKSALKELENKRFLKRVQINKRGVFGENDYIIFDEPYPLDENHPTVPPVEKPTAEKPTAEKRPTLVKTNLVNQEEKRENIITSPLPEIIEEIKSSDLICSSPSDYPLIEEYISYVSKKAKLPLFYGAVIRESLLNDSSHSHNRTFLAYTEFANTRPDINIGSLPVGVNVFDLIGRE